MSERKSAGHSVQAFNRAARNENVSRKFTLATTAAVAASSGAGTMLYSLSMDPSGAQDWALISGYYDEFRVIGIRLRLVSTNTNSAALINDQGIVIFDNDSTAVNTFANGLQYANKVWIPFIFAHTNGKVWTHVYMRPENNTSPTLWVDVATPASSLGSVQILSQIGGLTASTNYLNVAIEYFVEARGRR